MSRISIVIPVYYNEDTLELLYDDLKSKVLNQLTDYELVFVDDGSEDHSWEVMNRLREQDEKIQCVRLSRNFGEHAAILAGLSVCTGDCAVTKQADLQEDSAIILEMYASWQQGNKVVLAVREDREDSLSTKIFAGLYYRMIKAFANKKMPVGGCDCYLLDRKAIAQVLLMEEKNSSLTLQVLWIGFQTDLVYMHRLERKVGKGRWTFAKKFKLVLDSMVSFSYVPIRLMWIIGILFFIFAVIMGLGVIIEWFTTGTPVAGWSSLMSVVLCSSGLMLLMFGLLGEYVWRTFDAARKRPPFIIDEIKSGLDDKDGNQNKYN